MIFGKRKHKLPETREEYDAAISKGLAAIIQTDITTDIDIDDGPLDGDPLISKRQGDGGPMPRRGECNPIKS